MGIRRLFRAKCIATGLLLALAPSASAARPTQLVNAFASLGVTAGFGSGAAKDESIVASRTLLPIGIAASLGLRIGPVLLGGTAEYQAWQQSSDPAQNANSNLAGGQGSYGPALGLRIGPLSLLGKYFLSSTYKFKRPDAAGRSLEYPSPASAYAIELQLRSVLFTYFGLEYSAYQYRKEKRGGAGSTLTAAEKMNFQAVKVHYGLSF